jgi:integrase
VEGFVNYLESLHLAENTIKSMVYRVSFIEQTYGNISLKTVNQYVRESKARGNKNNGINVYIKAIRKYGQYIKDPDLAKYKSLPESAVYKATMSDSEIEDFLALPPRSRNRESIELHHTMRVFWSIMAYTGARCHEVANLTVSDIEDNTLIIHATKTKTYRKVPLASPIQETVSEYIKQLPTSKLFPGMHAQRWGYDFHRRLKELGIKRKGLTPYSMRHSYATRMADSDGVNVFDLKNILGHKNIDMTERYYHTSVKRLKKVMARDPLVISKTGVTTVLTDIFELLKGYGFDESKCIKCAEAVRQVIDN